MGPGEGNILNELLQSRHCKSFDCFFLSTLSFGWLGKRKPWEIFRVLELGEGHCYVPAI